MREWKLRYSELREFLLARILNERYCAKMRLRCNCAIPKNKNNNVFMWTCCNALINKLCCQVWVSVLLADSFLLIPVLISLLGLRPNSVLLVSVLLVTKDASNSLVIFRTPGSRSLYWPRTQKKGPLWAKRMSAYIRVWEVKCLKARTNSAINNPQASSYIRAPEGVARRGIRAAEKLCEVRRHWLVSQKFIFKKPVRLDTHWPILEWSNLDIARYLDG